LPSRCDVTVITALYNCEPYLEECVWSVQEQTLAPKEHIIVDDCSTDGGYCLALRLAGECTAVPIRVLRLPENSGAAAARNAATAAACTGFVGIMDADDIALPDWLEAAYPAIVAVPHVAAVGGGVVYMDEEGRALLASASRATGSCATTAAREGQMPFAHPGALLRRTSVVSSGGYDPSMRAAEDFDLILRLSLCYDLLALSRPLVLYRLRPSSLGHASVYEGRVAAYLRAKAAMLQASVPNEEAKRRLAAEWDAVEAAHGVPVPPGSFEYTMAMHYANAGRGREARQLFARASAAGYRPRRCTLLSAATRIPGLSYRLLQWRLRESALLWRPGSWT